MPIGRQGDIAQLIERFAGSEEVRGLSPRISTINMPEAGMRKPNVNADYMQLALCNYLP